MQAKQMTISRHFHKVLLLFSCTILTHSIHLSSLFFDIKPLSEILQENSTITYIPCSDKQPFSFKKHPFFMGDKFHPYQGTFNPTFILKIPNGIAHSEYGWVLDHNHFIQEMIWKNLEWILDYVHDINTLNPAYISGDVVVLGQPAYFNYFHMLTEILCRLALVEKANIPYDKVYIAQDMPFLKGAFELWGLQEDQIIQPFDETFCIQADTLILPSLVSNTNHETILFSSYPHKDLLLYVRQKLLNAALSKSKTPAYPPKIFISRNDAPQRKMSNENEIFALLEPFGFKKYILSNLPIAEQILLFHNAKIIIAAHGASLTNSMFCQPKTKVFEIFQTLNDSSLAHIAEICNLQYIPIKTTEFITDFNEATQVQEQDIPLIFIENLIAMLQSEEA